MSIAQEFWEGSVQFCHGNLYILFSVYGTLLMSLWYIIVNIPFIVLDFTRPKWVEKYKVQEKKTVSVEKFLSAIPQIAFNSVVVGIFIASIFYFIGKQTGVSYAREIPSIWIVLRDIFFSVLVEEAGFYYSHRLFHQPYFYKRIHKIHHQWTAPISITSIYCHPIEHAFSNLMPILLGPTILGSHVVTAWIWFAVAIASTTISHCGYHFPLSPSPQQHDYHHLAFNENFGVLGILDTIHGTNKTFRKSIQGQRNRTYVSAKSINEIYEKVERKSE